MGKNIFLAEKMIIVNYFRQGCSAGKKEENKNKQNKKRAFIRTHNILKKLTKRSALTDCATASLESLESFLNQGINEFLFTYFLSCPLNTCSDLRRICSKLG